MAPSSKQLAELFESADVGWVFDPSTFGEAPDATAARILREMDLVDQAYLNRFGRLPSPPIASAVFVDAERLKPLIQAFASPTTAEMRAMIYAVLDGAEVLSVEFLYESKARSQLRVVVEYEGGQRAEFRSDDVSDFEVLRHFGAMKLGDKPVIDGYYAFRKAAG